MKTRENKGVTFGSNSLTPFHSTRCLHLGLVDQFLLFFFSAFSPESKLKLCFSVASSLFSDFLLPLPFFRFSTPLSSFTATAISSFCRSLLLSSLTNSSLSLLLSFFSSFSSYSPISFLLPALYQTHSSSSATNFPFFFPSFLSFSRSSSVLPLLSILFSLSQTQIFSSLLPLFSLSSSSSFFFSHSLSHPVLFLTLPIFPLFFEFPPPFSIFSLSRFSYSFHYLFFLSSSPTHSPTLFCFLLSISPLFPFSLYPALLLPLQSLSPSRSPTEFCF